MGQKDSFKRMVPETKTKTRIWLEKFWLGRTFFYFADIKFIRFLMVAGLNTLFGIMVFILLRTFVTDKDWLAALLGQIIGIFFNFFTYGSIVFKNGKWYLLPRFICVYAIMYFTNIGGLALLKKYWLIEMFGRTMTDPALVDTWAANTAAAFMAVPVGFLGFFLNKMFVFERKNKQQTEQETH